MTKYDVNISINAHNDIDNIYNYISTYLQSSNAASNQLSRIYKAIYSLDTFPARHKLFDEEPEHSLGIRKMLIDNFLVCYIIKSNIVTILSVIYKKADIHSKLRKLYSKYI